MDFDIEYVTAQTDDIVISACQAFLEEDEADSCSYYLRIENNSDEKIQILGKDFNFTDDRGNSFCDNAPGFKGEIPELEPGEYFEFASSAPVNAVSAYTIELTNLVDGFVIEEKNVALNDDAA